MKATILGLLAILAVFSHVPVASAVLAPKKASALFTVGVGGGGGGCGGSADNYYFDTVVALPLTPVAPFTPPAGQVFVVNSVQATLAYNPNVTAQVQLFINDGTNSSFQVFQNRTTDAAGRAFLDFAFPAGLVLKPGQWLCIGGPAFSALVSGHMNGFLAKDN